MVKSSCVKLKFVEEMLVEELGSHVNGTRGA